MLFDLSVDQLTEILNGENLNTNFDPKTEYCHYEGELADSRKFVAGGHLRDGVLDLKRIDVWSSDEDANHG